MTTKDVCRINLDQCIQDIEKILHDAKKLLGKDNFLQRALRLHEATEKVQFDSQILLVFDSMSVYKRIKNG